MKSDPTLDAKKAAKFIYLAQKTIETAGDVTHLFLTCLHCHFLQMMEAIKSKLSKCFPAPTTKTRLVQQCLDRIQGWYIRRVVQQEKFNEQRAEYKAKIGKVICQRNFNNLYGDPKCAEITVTTAEVAGHSLSSGTQTYGPQKVDTAMQTEAAHLSPLENNQALIMLDTGDVQVMQTISEPFNPEQVHHVSAPQPQGHSCSGREHGRCLG